MKHKNPCDNENVGCPFDANGSMDCYNNCGLGADEHESGYDQEIHEDDDYDFTHELEPATEPKKIIIQLEGGLVQHVMSNSGEAIEVMVIEYGLDQEPCENAEEKVNDFVGDCKFENIGHDMYVVPDDYKVGGEDDQ